MVALPPSGNSPAGCGKLATFHVVARDEFPGHGPQSSHPGGVLDIRPIPSHGSPLHQTPHLDSGHPKSTVDLGRQPLIWGDHALFRLPHAETASPKTIETLGIFSASRHQSEIQPNQAKKLFPTVDLGCLPFRTCTNRIASHLTCYSPSPGGEYWCWVLHKGQFTCPEHLYHPAAAVVNPCQQAYKRLATSSKSSAMRKISHYGSLPRKLELLYLLYCVPADKRMKSGYQIRVKSTFEWIFDFNSLLEILRRTVLQVALSISVVYSVAYDGIYSFGSVN
jgi:hypothetical protein